MSKWVVYQNFKEPSVVGVFDNRLDALNYSNKFLSTRHYFIVSLDELLWLFTQNQSRG